MKRSDINELIRQAKAFFAQHCFAMPPFAHWTPEQWKSVGPEADEIRQCGLGWDLTDFGSGDYHKIGLLLFTIRNGHVSQKNNGKAYAEKIMIVEPGQVTPWHYHEAKMEDIINRGGGRLVIDVRCVDASGQPTNEDVTVSTDGVARTVPAGASIILSPGESITMTRRLAHQFYGENGAGRVLVGEVSDVNDDNTDNYFLTPVGRFPVIDEDEPPIHLLCTEYPPTSNLAGHKS
jgi:D-lyxose ketol-isomerase